VLWFLDALLIHDWQQLLTAVVCATLAMTRYLDSIWFHTQIASWCICKSGVCFLTKSVLQAADRFMRLMEKKGPTAPQHLVVFITSDEDFSEQIAQLQSRNFQVAVLYHYPSASKKAAAIGHAANISHDWLPFLTSSLNNPHLTLTYDPNLYYPAGPAHPNQGRRQNFAGSPQQAAALAQGPKFGQLPAAQVQPSAWAADPVSSSSCVAVYGLQEGEPPIARRVALLLAQHAGQQVADNAKITVLLGSRGSFAVMDFSKAAEPIKQAANVVSALDGQFWGDSQLKVRLYADKGAASRTCSSNQPIMRRPAVQSVPSHDRVANGSCSIGVIEPSSNAYKGNGYKSNINGYRCNSADHNINGNGYKATPGRPQGGNGNVTMPSRGQAGSSCPSSYGYQGRSHGSPMDLAITKADCSNSGSKQLAICSSEPAAKGKADSKASQPQSGVAWGFISALDGTCEAFSPDDSVMLEQQWNKLQSAEADTQAASQHRYYLLLHKLLCNM